MSPICCPWSRCCIGGFPVIRGLICSPTGCAPRGPGNWRGTRRIEGPRCAQDYLDKGGAGPDRVPSTRGTRELQFASTTKGSCFPAALDPNADGQIDFDEAAAFAEHDVDWFCPLGVSFQAYKTQLQLLYSRAGPFDCDKAQHRHEELIRSSSPLIPRLRQCVARMAERLRASDTRRHLFSIDGLNEAWPYVVVLPDTVPAPPPESESSCTCHICGSEAEWDFPPRQKVCGKPDGACSKSSDCYPTGQPGEYRGYKSTTASGKMCQHCAPRELHPPPPYTHTHTARVPFLAGTAQSPHSHSQTLKKNGLPGGNSTHN